MSRTQYLRKFSGRAAPRVKFVRTSEHATIPKTWSDQAVGLDIHALAISDSGRPNNVVIPPRTTRKMATGILIETPPGYAAWVLSRSGLAQRSVFVANAPGLIDPDYRGEIFVLLYNGSFEPQIIAHGERIAQLALFPATLIQTEIVEQGQLSRTARGIQGFGSTGC